MGRPEPDPFTALNRGMGLWMIDSLMVHDFILEEQQEWDVPKLNEIFEAEC